MILLRWTALCLVVLTFFLFYQLVWSGNGYFAYKKLQRVHSDMQQRLRIVDQENLQLSQEIRTLKNDPEYLSRVVRTKIHYLEEDELLYLFPHNKP